MEGPTEWPILQPPSAGRYNCSLLTSIAPLNCAVSRAVAYDQRMVSRFLLCLMMVARALPLFSAPDQKGVSLAIRDVMVKQEKAWNDGNLDSFIKFYAPDCTYVSKTIVQGREQVLARYRRTYSNRASMGHLTFSGLQVNPVDAHTATVLGHFQLDRTAEAGGPASGIFSLVFHEDHGQWSIILDHTS